MKFQTQSLVYVYYMGGEDKYLIGRLLLKERRIFFEYDAHFIKKGLELSPFKLPLQSGVIASPDRTFDGLFGLFNDSLPDGWGRLLLDRKLIKAGLSPGSLSPLDRLCFVGSNGMGALVYEPENLHELTTPFKDLDEIAEDVKNFQENADDRFIDDLLTLGGSSAGARPKVLVRLADGDWLVKFRSHTDPQDIGNIEYAYHLMAKASNVDVPEAKLFPSRNSGGFFGVKRFDRIEGRKIHMHSVSGLLHADPRESCLDYETIIKATWLLTRDIREVEKQFRNAAFSVLNHNRDDHAKNFSYLMSATGTWRVSPAYDLTFSSGPSGEHSTMVMGEGKNPNLTQLLKLAAVGGIKKQKALVIIDEVTAATTKWPYFASVAGVNKSSTTMIQNSINHIKFA